MSKVENLHGNQDMVLAKFSEDLADLIYERAEAHNLNFAQIVGVIETIKFDKRGFSFQYLEYLSPDFYRLEFIRENDREPTERDFIIVD